jgi:hypothetical protein
MSFQIFFSCGLTSFDMMDNSKQVPRNDLGRTLLDRSGWMSPTSCREGRIPMVYLGFSQETLITRTPGREPLGFFRWRRKKEWRGSGTPVCHPPEISSIWWVGRSSFVKVLRKKISLFEIQITPNGIEIHQSASGFMLCPQDGMEGCIGRGGSPLQGTAWWQNTTSREGGKWFAF